MRGTQLRPPEMAEAFAAAFWLDEIEPNCFAEHAYLDEITPRLPERFARFPRPSLRILGGRIWLSRKPPGPLWRRLFRRDKSWELARPSGSRGVPARKGDRPQNGPVGVKKCAAPAPI
ncbi:MAG: hypothetical protein WDN69_06245 [Aliidongia sp.]